MVRSTMMEISRGQASDVLTGVMLAMLRICDRGRMTIGVLHSTMLPKLKIVVLRAQLGVCSTARLIPV